MEEFSVLTPDGAVYQVPAQNLHTALNDLGGFLMDTGQSPSLQLQNGGIVESDIENAAGMLTAGQGTLLGTESIYMVDPEGTRRKVSKENIQVALDNGFQVIRKTVGNSAIAQDKQEAQDTEGGLEEKTWKTALGEVIDNVWSYLPFLNAVDIFKSADMYKLAKMRRNGEQLTPKEDEWLDAQLEDMSRPTSWGYKALSTALKLSLIHI